MFLQSVRMTMMSQLSDVQETLGVTQFNEKEHNRIRINFVKWLMLKYSDINTEIDVKAELDLFEEAEKKRKG